MKGVNPEATKRTESDGTKVLTRICNNKLNSAFVLYNCETKSATWNFQGDDYEGLPYEMWRVVAR
jgi:hypothetical protein